MGSTTHEVFDVPVTAFHPFVQKNIPDTIASDPSGQTLRLYVPKSKNGYIGDIALMNGVYAAPGAPFHRDGEQIYIAPASAQKYHSFADGATKGRLRLCLGSQRTSTNPRPGIAFT